jgi:hypothetical protein
MCKSKLNDLLQFILLILFCRVLYYFLFLFAASVQKMVYLDTFLDKRGGDWGQMKGCKSVLILYAFHWTIETREIFHHFPFYFFHPYKIARSQGRNKVKCLSFTSNLFPRRIYYLLIYVYYTLKVQ